jgi:hypothetical protein
MTIAADLDGNVWLCPACRSSLRIVNWQVWGDDCEECHPRNRVATTEAAVLELTGWSEERLLRDAYLVATESFRVNPEWGGGPLVAHVERRLGMRPPVPGEGDFDEVRVLTVAEALEVFHRKALPAAPHVGDEARSYRIWRTPDRLWFYGSEPDTLGAAQGPVPVAAW